jgi:hypothetical protein
MPQQQIQKQQVKSSTKRTGTNADAPTVNSKIAKLWFGGQS